ncbi:transient receptor potential cation channel subfamily a member 1-like [Gigaspora margarita]|uniref:Transient receptor potential cation channel subfamily a member 1-like n=1 Tax=Gigaspora margarita TaxID=4874 RepID=A0A8H4A299_GIGMA|nr:transient receptor potential cation channel subfamily a member 1-like [Gigaspora margarita]
MQFIATWSDEDKSIVGWTIMEELTEELTEKPTPKPYYSINIDEFRSIFYPINQDKLRSMLKEDALIGVSNHKQVILKIDRDDPYNFEIIDIKSKSRQILNNVQGLKGIIDNITFLENGELNGRLLMLFGIPSIIVQWNLVTREFEEQYILDWEPLRLNFAYYKFMMQLNNDSTLLAVVAQSIEDSKTLLIYVYSSESGIVIQKLSLEENWKNYLQDKDYEHYMGNMFCNVKEIREFIQETLKKYKQGLMQNTPREIKKYDGKPYSWIIIYKYISYWKCYEIYLKAQVESREKIEESNEKIEDIEETNEKIEEIEETNEKIEEIEETNEKIEETNETILLEIFDTAKDYLLEIKPSGIQIWTVDSENIRLLYYWVDEFKLMKEIKKESVKVSMINNIDIFIDKLNLHSKILPPPILPPKDPLLFWDDRNYRYRFIDKNTIDYWIKDESILKFYGKGIIFKLLQMDRTEEIMSLFNNCLHNCQEKFNSGDLSNFMFLIVIITSTLVDLESYNKNLRVTEKFLSKINLLVPEKYQYAINKNSLSIHLQHCGIYNYLHIVNTSFLDRLTFWVFEKWNLLKISFNPQISKISSYFTTNYTQETVMLMNPLLNFATYSKDYSSYSKIFCLPRNSFNSLDSSDYCKWWNIKAIINFKWNSYGKQYYFVMWTFYSIFMFCFLIVSTISNNQISWSKRVVFLMATILLGFIQMIFEIRQFIHRPLFYITSPWNWFDLAAILFPTIASLVWLHIETPSTWVITFAVFLLEVKFLLFFHALRYFGKYFAIVIGVAQKVFSFLIVLAIIVLAFAHSLYLLLRPTSDYSYEKPSHTNDPNNP